MTDKELAEMAAKAAGIEFGWVDPKWGDPEAVPYLHFPNGALWNPLIDDGDALRLAVKLGMDINIYTEDEAPWVQVFCTRDKHELEEVEEVLGTDPYAATRRAIVRAAAKFGRAIT